MLKLLTDVLHQAKLFRTANPVLEQHSMAFPILVAILLGLAAQFVQGQSQFPFASNENPLAAVSCSELPEMAAESTPSHSPRLSKRMQAAADHLSRRFLLSDMATQEVVQAAYDVGKVESVDPLLILAVIAVESGFNPFAESVMGAKGLMQVIPKYHPEKFPDASNDLTVLVPRNNIVAGTRVISEYLQKTRGNMTAALQRYAGASSDESAHYSKKVYAELARLQQAVAKSSLSASVQQS